MKIALAIQYDSFPPWRGSPDLGCIKRVFFCGKREDLSMYADKAKAGQS